jgi:hypothetical protein
MTYENFLQILFDKFCAPINIRQVSRKKRSETQVGVSVNYALLLTTFNESWNMQASNFFKIYLVVLKTLHADGLA